ncbi:MAG: hypothetical protein Q8P24_13795 [Desulfobacterales bacterium]|nr:hypothetical protein [Desulfobacterales bacterium]
MLNGQESCQPWEDILSLIGEKIAYAHWDESQKPWVIQGIHFDHGVLFRAKYKGYFYSAVVENGALVLKNRRFTSPTAAAFSITRQTHMDGWCFWECKLPEHDQWVPMSDMKYPTGFEPGFIL